MVSSIVLILFLNQVAYSQNRYTGLYKGDLFPYEKGVAMDIYTYDNLALVTNTCIAKSTICDTVFETLQLYKTRVSILENMARLDSQVLANRSESLDKLVGEMNECAQQNSKQKKRIGHLEMVRFRNLGVGVGIGAIIVGAWVLKRN